MKTWFAIIFLSSFAMLAFANMAAQRGEVGYEARLPAAYFSLTDRELEERATACERDKREALRVNDQARYRELVGDMACHHAELMVDAGRS